VHSPLLERGGERSLGLRITHPFAWKNRDTRKSAAQETRGLGARCEIPHPAVYRRSETGQRSAAGALVKVDEKELAASKEVVLSPGMAVTVMIPTKERTALDYLLGPLVASFDQSFRQK
jgi:hypothetical protein